MTNGLSLRAWLLQDVFWARASIWIPAPESSFPSNQITMQASMLMRQNEFKKCF